MRKTICTVVLFLLIGMTENSFAQKETKIKNEDKNAREFEMKDGDTVYVMKQYFLCIYIRGEKTDQDTATLNKLQAGHLAHINAMAKAGVICMAGPFGDNTEKRGILMFDLATKEEAETWVKKDPMVVAGRLTYEIHPWWGAKGSVLK